VLGGLVPAITWPDSSLDHQLSLDARRALGFDIMREATRVVG